MAKKDELNSPGGEAIGANSVDGARRGSEHELSVFEEIVSTTTELTDSIVRAGLRTVSAVTNTRSRLATRVIDFAEAAAQDVIRLAREANDSQSEVERQVVGASERVVNTTLRRIGGSAMALASITNPRTSYPLAARTEAPRAQA